jgi:hypothetical protein
VVVGLSQPPLVIDRLPAYLLNNHNRAPAHSRGNGDRASRMHHQLPIRFGVVG